MREEGVAEFFGEFLGVVVGGVVDGGGGAHGVADHVAAGAPGGEAGVGDGGDDFFEVADEDAVELDALAGGEAEVAVADGMGEVVVGEVLLGGEAAAGHFGTDHEAPGLVFFLFARAWRADRGRPAGRCRGI